MRHGKSIGPHAVALTLLVCVVAALLVGVFTHSPHGGSSGPGGDCVPCKWVKSVSTAVAVVPFTFLAIAVLLGVVAAPPVSLLSLFAPAAPSSRAPPLS
jgi:hypothetical protein